MARKLIAVLAWTALAAALGFVILSLTALFAWDALGETAPALVWYGAMPLVVLAILLAVAILIAGAFDRSVDEKK